MTTPDELRAELAAADHARTVARLRGWLQRAEDCQDPDLFPRLLGEGQAHVAELLRLIDREQER